MGKNRNLQLTHEPAARRPLAASGPYGNVTVTAKRPCKASMGWRGTLASELGMSALPLKADMLSVSIDVRLVPIADIAVVLKSSGLSI